MHKKKQSAKINHPFELTKEELLAYGERAAKLEKMIADLEIEKAVTAKTFKERIGGLRAECASLSRLIRDKREYREVDVEEVFNYSEKRVDYQYKGKVIETREMTENERQLELDIRKPSAEKKQAPGKDDKGGEIGNAGEFKPSEAEKRIKKEIEEFKQKQRSSRASVNAPASKPAGVPQ